MSIPRFIASALLLCVSFGSAQAQKAGSSAAPQWELFGGGTFTRLDLSPDLAIVGTDHLNAWGWNGSISEYLNTWFGGTIDLSGAYSHPKFTFNGLSLSDTIRLSTFTAMGGPTFAWRKSGKVQPFGRVLFGVVHAHAETTSKGALLIGTSLARSDDSFGVGAGGGVDFKLSKQLAARATLDWIHSSFRDFGDDSQNHLRASVGLVFRFGEK
jgi:opacity protein-like surface antigen